MKSILAGVGGAALLVLGAQAALAATITSTGTTFVKNAIQGDNAEIKMGQLAQQNGGSQGVKGFGKTLVTDHTAAKQEAESVAKQMGVTPPPDVKPDAQQAYDKLSKMSGASFDREFAQHMVMDHRKDIAEFREQARAGLGPASNLAAKQLPTLEKHLRTAEDLQKQSP
jgi:putative membrane protein